MQPTKEKEKEKQPSPELVSPVNVDRRTDYSSTFKWVVHNFPNIKAKSLYSPYIEVGGFDFRFLMYPKGDSLCLPGHISLYLQINDPRGSFDCCAYYKITIVNVLNDSKCLYRESCYRFSKTRKSIGWAEFTVSKTLLDPSSGFLNDGSLLISVDIHVLSETKSFSGDGNEIKSFVSDGRLTWTIRNYGLFKDIVKTQKLISPSFQVGEGNLRIHLYRTLFDGVEYLSLFLDTNEKCILFDRSCCCLFRIALMNQKPGLHHVHRDSHGRFSLHGLFRDNTTLGWLQYMKMSDFTDGGFLVDDTVVINVSFHAIKESSIVFKTGNPFGGKGAVSLFKKGETCSGKFLWKIENFVTLKDILKKKKLTGLCVKSRTFQIGNMDFRLLVYPRGMSQKPFHLSLFLEVLDLGNRSRDWSSFVMYRLVVTNQKTMDKSIIKESQDRCSKETKNLGWSEFMTLTNFFNQDSGYLDQDTAVFTAEVRVLKETFILKSLNETSSEMPFVDSKRCSVTWKVENFSSLKDVMATQKIFCKFFEVDGCKFRIGFYESSENICACLESDPSAASNSDENFWVSYRIALVNQKDHAKSLWKKSSQFTKSCTTADLQFMSVSDMLEAGVGFVVREMAIFTCEILDCCPWFEFSGAEDDGNDLSNGINELYNPGDRKVITGKLACIFNVFLLSAGCYLGVEDSSRRLLVKLKELLMGTGAAAGVLLQMRLYLDDPVRVKCLLTKTKSTRSSSRKKNSGADKYSAKLTTIMTAVKLLQQTINDILLDIMVECCQPSNNSTDDNFSASSIPSAYDNPTVCQPESHVDVRSVVPMQSSVYEGPTSGVNVTSNSSVVECLISNGDDLFKDAIFGQCALHLESSASDPMEYNFFQALKAQWPEPSEKLLQLILDSLKTLNGSVSQVDPKPRQRSQSAERVFMLLEKAPKHLHSDLVILLPKLLNSSEHHLVACALLDHLNQLDVQPALQPPVLATISQLNLANEERKQIVSRAYQLLGESNGEVLEAVIDFLVEAASQCQHIPQAVRAVHARLERLGAKVPSYVLDLLSKIVNSRHEVAESMLREIDSAFALDECSTNNKLISEEGKGPEINCLHSVDEPSTDANHHFSDIFLLINILAIPSLAGKATQVFERGIAYGFIEYHSVALVLDRHAQRFSVNLESSAYQHEATELKKNADSFYLDRVFTLVITLARKLSLSGNSRVQGFVKMFYMMLFRLFSSESDHNSMLKGLVDLATRPADTFSQINLDILVFLILEEQKFARPILSMMRDAVQNISTDHSTIQHRLCTIEKELFLSREEYKDELSNLSAEKAILLERLSQSEAAVIHHKSEMMLQMDRFACEKKELCGRIKAVESELEQCRSKQNKKVLELYVEKKDYQDHLHHVETQISQLKSGKCHELKKVAKERKVLAEKLKHVEAERQKFDREVRRYAVEVVAQEEVWQTLMDKTRQMKQKIQQIEGVKQEKEEEIAHCRAYAEHIEAKLSSCQEYIRSLENALEDEMLQHAPLYGVGLEDLSMKELETLKGIHEDGLKEIHNLQHRSSSSDVVVSSGFDNLPSTANTVQPYVSYEQILGISDGVEKHNNWPCATTAPSWF